MLLLDLVCFSLKDLTHNNLGDEFTQLVNLDASAGFPFVYRFNLDNFVYNSGGFTIDRSLISIVPTYNGTSLPSSINFDPSTLLFFVRDYTPSYVLLTSLLYLSHF